MRHALTTPMFGSVLVGLALAAGGLYARTDSTDHRAEHRLVLHTYAEPNALYLSAWDHGDVRVTLDGSERKPLRFTVRASVSDGCRWLATETLEPIDQRTYSYRYEEKILECDADATPCRKTPRTGIVTVED
jgi:hypothetical protein